MKRLTLLYPAFLLAILMFACAAPPALAQGGPPAAAPGEEVKGVAMAQLKLMGKNIVAIAQEVPADKYTWNPGSTYSPRPADYTKDDYGRGFCNLLLHIANLNFSRPGLMNVAAALGFNPKDYETSTTDRTVIVGQLTMAFAYAEASVGKLTAADLAKMYKVGDHETSGNAIVAQWMENINDYFGQTKAYARMLQVIGTDPGGFGPYKLQSQK